MALDFPRAWELARAAAATAHDLRCSYLQTSGALLCDTACPVIAHSTEFQCAAMHGVGGGIINMAPPYGPCPGHQPA